MIKKAEHYRASGKAANKKWRRLALTSATVLAIAFILQLILRQLFFFPLTITGDSMIPEIKSGDKRYFVYAKISQPALGDVVLVHSAVADVEYLCRIAASDGDKVKISAGQLLINGQLKKELPALLNSPLDRSFFMPETEVRPNNIFCLNDNARNTSDSRVHGMFARSQIIARVIRPTLFF